MISLSNGKEMSTESGNKIRVLMLGDSLTAGYGVSPGAALPDVLEDKLRREGFDVKMINAGLSGDTAEGGLARLPLLMREEFDAAVVEFGTNDAFMGLAPESVYSAMGKIMRRLGDSGADVLLAGARVLSGEGADYAARFARIYEDLAEEYGVLLHPFVLEGVLDNPDLVQWDGLHPNERGILVMAERMLPKVRELVRRVSDRNRGPA
jgi:acyl-CoA thioesterase-1